MYHFIQALRPKQWIKNLFIFIPVIFGQELFNLGVLQKTTIAFILFSIMASAVYLFNDIVDLQQDKLHAEKKKRPIASGKLSLTNAKITVFILSSIAITSAILLNLYFGWLLAGYFLLNLVYSMILKKIVIIDVFCIGAFYLLRIIAGTIIAEVEFSHWMIFMIILIAIFLSFNKRRQELVLGGKESRSSLAKYSPYFIDQMISIITSTIIVSYMMYTVDKRTIAEFGTTNLTFTIPFVYYGIFRYLYLVHKEKVVDDPTFVLYSDTPMQINLIFWIFSCIFIIYLK